MNLCLHAWITLQPSKQNKTTSVVEYARDILILARFLITFILTLSHLKGLDMGKLHNDTNQTVTKN